MYQSFFEWIPHIVIKKKAFTHYLVERNLDIIAKKNKKWFSLKFL